MIRFTVWSIGESEGTVAIDPFSVTAVHETVGKGYHGRTTDPVAVIRLTDGSEYTVEDGGRVAADNIARAKSVIIS